MDRDFADAIIHFAPERVGTVIADVTCQLGAVTAPNQITRKPGRADDDQGHHAQSHLSPPAA